MKCKCNLLKGIASNADRGGYGAIGSSVINLAAGHVYNISPVFHILQNSLLSDEPPCTLADLSAKCQDDHQKYSDSD